MDNNSLVCITGSRGLLGSAFVDYCKENKIRYQTLLPFPCSLTHLKEALTGGKITHFINAAGFSNDMASISQPYETYKSNVLCVLNQLESIRNFSPTTKYVNFGSIYEDDKVTPYSSSKRMARELVRTYRANYGIPAFQATLSFTEYYREGADRMLVKIIRKLIKLKNSGKTEPITLYNPDDRFNFTWATDVVGQCFVEMENHRESNPYLFNTKKHSLKEITGMILEELELASNLVEFTSDKDNGRAHIQIKPSSFTGKVTMREIVRNLVQFELKMGEKIMDRETYGKPT